MMTGEWEGEYIDLGGHRGRLRFSIAKADAQIGGDFELSLATEDQAERYQGALSGEVDGDRVVLRLHMPRGEPIVGNLTLRQPVTHAEQVVYGVVEPAPAMKLGGGVLIAWRFRQE